MTLSKRGNDHYSYRGDATCRVVASIVYFPTDEIRLDRTRLAEFADVSLPTSSRVVGRLIEDGLLAEGELHRVGAFNKPVYGLEKTPAFDPAVANNPEWSRASVITGIMMATGRTEGWILDNALALAGPELETLPISSNQLVLPFDI